MYRIVLEHISTKKTYNFNAEDKNNGEKLYFRFQIPLTDVEDGKYKLFVYQDEELIKEDILVIGDFNAETLQYQRGENVYIETKLDAKVEDVVEVTVRDIETVIKPSAEYDVMEKVIVNAQPIYEQGSTDGYNRGTVDGYNDGFNQGKTQGIEQGIEQGKEEQKSKLVPLTVTENGSYSRTDGYSEVNVMVADVNGSYDEGYTDGFDAGKIEGEQVGKEEQKSLMVRTNITRNAVYSREDGYNEVEVNVQPETDILNITENGIYKTNISENNDFIKTAKGVFDDGTPFFNYAKVKGSYFVTNLYPKADSKIEVWFNNISFNCSIVGNRISNKKEEEFTITNSYSYPNNQYFEKDVLVFGIGGNYYGFENADKWKHIEMSVSNGIWINGVKYADVDVEYLGGSTPFCICNDSIESSYSENELFIGMVKIDGKTFIPTAEGFIDYETKELLEKHNTYGEYEFFNVEQTINEKPFRTVFVDVQPKINVAKEKIKFAYSQFTEIPDYFDFSDVTDMSDIFRECKNLKTISKIDSSNVTNLTSAFYYCQNLTHIDYLDTSNVVNMQQTFGTCTSLKSLCALNVPKLVVPSSINIFGYVDLNKFTDFGGFINLKTSLSNNNNLKKCPNLTYQSCINVLNGLYDFTGNGETPNSNQGQLSVHPNFLTTVGDEISIGTTKGWTITA